MNEYDLHVTKLVNKAINGKVLSFGEEQTLKGYKGDKSLESASRGALQKHEETKEYLQSLSPSERMQLLGEAFRKQNEAYKIATKFLKEESDERQKRKEEEAYIQYTRIHGTSL